MYHVVSFGQRLRRTRRVSRPEIGYTRDAYEKTVATATAHGSSTVVPWISLGCGYRRGFPKGAYKYDLSWNYDYIYSWQLGSEINNAWYGNHPEQFAHWTRAPHVVFYPAIFDPRLANVSAAPVSAVTTPRQLTLSRARPTPYFCRQRP